MFKYVIKEKAYINDGNINLVERCIIGSNSMSYIEKAYRELLSHQELKKFNKTFSWFTVDQYENNILVASDIMF